MQEPRRARRPGGVIILQDVQVRNDGGGQVLTARF
jgi:hypothetical protein